MVTLTGFQTTISLCLMSPHSSRVTNTFFDPHSLQVKCSSLGRF
jgi:hypothetical protein